MTNEMRNRIYKLLDAICGYGTDEALLMAGLEVEGDADNLRRSDASLASDVEYLLDLNFDHDKLVAVVAAWRERGH